MTRTIFALIASTMLCAGCAVRTLTLPDPSIPHRVASEATVEIWVRGQDGTLTKQKVKIEEGWYLASPMVVDRPHR